jgi:hypothetical protein
MKYLFLLFPMCLFAQIDSPNRYVELTASLDPNSYLNIIDNPRMENDHQGLDFDIELAATDRRAYVYLFYGRFERAAYQNYGAGYDYIFTDQRLTLKAGAGLSVILRKQYFGYNLDRIGWGSALGYHFRTTAAYRLSDNISLVSRIQYQRRPDINTGTLEGSVGIAVRFYRKL